MSYDYIGPLPALKEIALLFPNVRIILNHLGGNVGPAMESERLEQWKVEMADVAASCPNVFCKCGGVQMVTHGHGWETRATPVGSEELADAVRPSLDYPHLPRFPRFFPGFLPCSSARSSSQEDGHAGAPLLSACDRVLRSLKMCVPSKISLGLVASPPLPTNRRFVASRYVRVQLPAR